MCSLFWIGCNPIAAGFAVWAIASVDHVHRARDKGFRDLCARPAGRVFHPGDQNVNGSVSRIRCLVKDFLCE